MAPGGLPPVSAGRRAVRHNEAPPPHNEIAECSHCHTESGYAEPEFRYAEPEFCYAGPESCYAEPEFRYAEPEFCYAEPAFCYAHPEFRYAEPEFRYAAAEGCYAAGRFCVKCARLRVDAMVMLAPFTPEPNVERQRRFRERNPGYYSLANRARRAAERQAQGARVLAAIREMGIVAPREPLMLPAPVEVLEIPGMNAIPAAMPVREAVAVPLTAGAASGQRRGQGGEGDTQGGEGDKGGEGDTHL